LSQLVSKRAPAKSRVEPKTAVARVFMEIPFVGGCRHGEDRQERIDLVMLCSGRRPGKADRPSSPYLVWLSEEISAGMNGHAVPAVDELASGSAAEEVIKSRQGEIGSDIVELLAKARDGFTGIGRELSHPSGQALKVDAVAQGVEVDSDV